MSNLKEIHDRIKSVGDTMKITNAMYMISSNKMMKAKREHEKTQEVADMFRRKRIMSIWKVTIIFQKKNGSGAI